MFKQRSLQTKITILVTVIVTLAVLIMMAFFAEWTVDNVQDKVEKNVLNIAKTVAHSKTIRSQLEEGDANQEIRSYVQEILEGVDEVEFIVVADMNSIRYSHPNPERIDERFMGGDQKRVVENGATYVSEATGTLGKSLRAFTPVYSLEGNKQIGFVSVGTLASSIDQAKHEAFNYIVVSSLVALVMGSFGAFVLALSIKKTLLGLEPDEIAHLYMDKTAMLGAIDEGIIAIDKDARITMINDSAISILRLASAEEVATYLGKDVKEVFPTTRLHQILNHGNAEFDMEQRIESTVIMTNRVPIMDKGEIIGAIATFRDKTRVMKLAEELTGVRQIVDALRANTHEFMNKLHVLLGLIQMGEYDEAKDFIIKVRERQEQIIQQIMKQVKDTTLAALVLGKLNRAKELGIVFRVHPETSVESEHGIVTTQVLVTIIGNLLENSMEALVQTANEVREVSLLVVEMKDWIRIEVSDNGPGIPVDEKERIFTKGFSTKRGSRGMGLAIVKSGVDEFQGRIALESELGKGTRISAFLSKEVLR